MIKQMARKIDSGEDNWLGREENRQTSKHGWVRCKESSRAAKVCS